MYTLYSWRSYLGIVAVDFFHQEFARTVGDPCTAYAPGEVTRGSRLTDIRPNFLKKYPGSRTFALGMRLNFLGPIYSLCSWRRHPGIKDD